MKPKIIILIILTLLIFSTCSEEKKEHLLIYCGITMIQPMNEIAKEFEENNNCSIEIIKGGTGNLFNTFEMNKSGDLFLPGSTRYYKDKYKSFFSDTVTLGYNEACLMVRKGNPLNISSLEDLQNPEYRVVISNPQSGSIGKECKKILMKYGTFNEVLENVYKLTSDSKDLTKMILTDEADVAVNWSAICSWGTNSQYIEKINIDSQYSKKTPLTISLLKYSQNKKLSKQFIQFAASEEGRSIFNKYGF